MSHPVSTPPVSGTARNMAAFRALESVKPAAERLFSDPFAKRFLPTGQRLLVDVARTPALRRLIEHYVDRLAPGARTSGIARTRLIDDWLRGALADGARQVVVLGAGYDCRALRLPELAGIPVFEVDRPALVDLKRDHFDATPPNLKRVAIDFLKDSLADRLLASGYDASLPTTFIWEGVTNYLDDDAVAKVFDFIAAGSPSGSEVIFTYVHTDAVAGHFDAPGLEALLAALRERGEPWTFGFDPAALPDYLINHGLNLRADLGADEYRRLYWQVMPPDAVGYEFYRVAFATTGAADAAR